MTLMSPSGPEASVRCVAVIRPESGVKPTCRRRSNDAIDPSATPPDGVDAMRKQNRGSPVSQGPLAAVPCPRPGSLFP
jgi:hypothetical protein